MEAALEPTGKLMELSVGLGRAAGTQTYSLGELGCSLEVVKCDLAGVSGPICEVSSNLEKLSVWWKYKLNGTESQFGHTGLLTDSKDREKFLSLLTITISILPVW